MDEQPLSVVAARDETDQQLLARVAAQDREAFRELYISYHRRLSRFLMRLTNRYEIAEEIINDTLWIVWRQAGSFRYESRVSTWILGIAYRRTLKALRHLDPPAGFQAVPIDEELLLAPDDAAK